MARDSGDHAAYRTEVFPSLTAELLFAANLVASAPGLRTGIEAEWIARQKSQMDPAALAGLPRLQGIWWPTMGLCDLLCHLGSFQDVNAFAAEALALPIDRFLVILFNGDLSREQVAEARIQGAAWPGPPAGYTKFSDAEPEAYRRIFADPEGHRRALLDLVKASDTPWFRESYLRLVQETEGTVRTLEARLAVEDPMAVAESLRDKPLRGPRAFEVYTFVPSRLIGHRHIFSWGAGHAVLFVHDGALALNGPTETGAELAEFLKVLADRTRMDILRLLCCGPSYGKEIAAALGLTNATVSRHLDQLKAAGLVREERADVNNVKVLRYAPAALDSQLERLRNYLLHS